MEVEEEEVAKEEEEVKRRKREKRDNVTAIEEVPLKGIPQTKRATRYFISCRRRR